MSNINFKDNIIYKYASLAITWFIIIIKFYIKKICRFILLK
jgi:hypothetical protein